MQINVPLVGALQFSPMDGEQIKTTPICPSCGKPMSFSRAIPRFGPHPELTTYSCKLCGVAVTEADESGGRRDLS